MTQPIRSRQRKLSKPWWQERTFKISVALLGLLLVIVVMTVNVAKYETHLATGDVVLLELAPVDPRGFMQGDYMALSYALERDIFDALQPEHDNLEQEAAVVELESADLEQEADDSEVEFESDFRSYEPSEGYVILKIDNNNVGQFARLADNANFADLAKDEMAFYYRVRNNQVKLATNAFFFQEGQAQAFEMAEYGLFRVNDKGEPLLTDMVDKEFKVIKGASNKADKMTE